MRRFAFEAVALSAALTLAACGSQSGGESLDPKACDALKGAQSALDQPVNPARIHEAGRELGRVANSGSGVEDDVAAAFITTMTAGDNPTEVNVAAARAKVVAVYSQRCTE
jgi:hypothetical protein